MANDKNNKTYYMVTLASDQFIPCDAFCYDTLQEAYDSIIPDAELDANTVWEIRQVEVVKTTKVKIHSESKTVVTLDGKKRLSTNTETT